MSDKKRRQLRNYLINKRMQGPIVAVVIVSGFLVSLLNGSLYYFYVKGNYQALFRDTSFSDQYVQTLYNDLLAFGLVLVLISFVVTVVLSLYTLVLTHRTAGACYRISAVIDEIRAGNRNARIKLRKKDELQDIASSFNDMLDELLEEK